MCSQKKIGRGGFCNDVTIYLCNCQSKSFALIFFRGRGIGETLSTFGYVTEENSRDLFALYD